LRLGVGWSFVLEPEMVEQVFIREEAMVRGWSEADLWGWANEGFKED